MKRLLFLFLSSLLVLVSLIGCSSHAAFSTHEISVFAGSASKPALDEAASAFEKQTGMKVYLTYGGSGTVLSQMELSKTGDMYIPGSPDYLVKSESKEITDPASTKIIAYLVPAICVQSGNPKNIQSLSDLARPGVRVGIGNPSTVCLGLYAIEILDYNHLLEPVSKNIVTNAESCEKTATLVALSSVDAVIGWHVFHDWNPDAIDVVYLNPDEIPRIAYIPAAISVYVHERLNAQQFIDFLISKSGKDILKKWGYLTTETEARKFAPDAQIGGECHIPDEYRMMGK